MADEVGGSGPGGRGAATPSAGGELDARLRELEHELGERRKELQALYRLSKLVAERGSSLEEVFRGVIELVPPSWHWPEITAARIVFDGREHVDRRFPGEDAPRHQAPIHVEGALRGWIQVALREAPPAGEPAFLEEEQALLDVIAERLGSVAAGVHRERRLRRSEERFRLAVEQFPYAFVLYDAERRIRFVNRRAVEMTGLREEEILGRRDEEVQPPEVVGRFLPHLERALETRRAQSGECHLELPTGRYDILVSYVPVLDERGAILQVIGTTWDVTERNARERERLALEAQIQRSQKLESLGLLAGGVAHDFNNLLTIIRGQTELARAGGDAGPGAARALGSIEQAAEQASDLTRQMLVFAGREPMRREPLDAGGLVEDMRELLGSGVGRRAELHVEADPATPPVEADPVQLRQVVLNLVLNAAQALEGEGGVIRVRTAPLVADEGLLASARVGGGRSPGRYAAIEVADEGPGMEETTLQRIFDPFFTTKETGRGLGLAAVHGIVRGHGGVLAVESAPGRGTTFRVLLEPAGRTAGISAPAPEGPAPPPSARGRVLVAEDQPEVRSVVERILAQAGFEARTAADGEEAVALLRAEPEGFDVALLDLTMPRLDGPAAWRAMERIRAGIPVVFMSGFASRDEALRGIEAETHAFVSKPFRPAELVAAVARALAGEREG